MVQIGIKSVWSICALQFILLLLLWWHSVASHTVWRAGESSRPASTAGEASSTGLDASPWGDLVVKDMDLQRPDEYVESELKKDVSTAWNFKDLDMGQVRALLASCGLTDTELERAFAPESVAVSASSIAIKPTDDLLLSLPAETRGKLYAELSKNPLNYYMANPLYIKQAKIDLLLQDRKLPDETASLFKQLLYPRGSLSFFSDIDYMFRHIPDEKDRLSLMKVATSEPSVMMRLKIHPNTDVERLLSYWGGAAGVHYKDVRPLFESIKRMPEGGSISVLYLLPHFARERLYTFPMPPKPGEPTHDCFWSALNYFNEIPDDRFGDINYVGKYVKENYYQISRPGIHGDLIFVCDAKDTALHAAIYLADDVVFTKNGVGYMQPWVLMRMPDLLSFYSTAAPAHALVFRNKLM